MEILFIKHENSFIIWEYSQLGYPEGRSNKKRIVMEYFGSLLHLLFHHYSRLVYDYN
jgi:hypothetical protein